jgi:hypothetical protein
MVKHWAIRLSPLRLMLDEEFAAFLVSEVHYKRIFLFFVNLCDSIFSLRLHENV